MAIQITSGFSLALNDSAPGVLNYWILDDEIASVTTGSNQEITGYTSLSGSGQWFRFQCADSEGEWSSPATAGSGGIEYVLNATYRIGGTAQSSINALENLLQSSRFGIVAEMRNGQFINLTRVGASATGASFGSGVGGGGALAIGSTITFVAQDSEPPTTVTVATTLDAITDA